MCTKLARGLRLKGFLFSLAARNGQRQITLKFFAENTSHISPFHGSWPVRKMVTITAHFVGSGIASVNGSLTYHRLASGKLWDAQTPASRPHDGAQGLRYVLKLDVSPTTREG